MINVFKIDLLKKRLPQAMLGVRQADATRPHPLLRPVRRRRARPSLRGGGCTHLAVVRPVLVLGGARAIDHELTGDAGVHVGEGPVERDARLREGNRGGKDRELHRVRYGT